MAKQKNFSTTVNISLNILGEDYYVVCDVDYRPGTESQLYGPPEDCYEGDPASYNITGMTLYLDRLSDKPKFPLALPDWLKEQIVSHIYEDRYDEICRKCEK